MLGLGVVGTIIVVADTSQDPWRVVIILAARVAEECQPEDLEGSPVWTKSLIDLFVVVALVVVAVGVWCTCRSDGRSKFASGSGPSMIAP